MEDLIHSPCESSSDRGLYAPDRGKRSFWLIVIQIIVFYFLFFYFFTSNVRAAELPDQGATPQDYAFDQLSVSSGDLDKAVLGSLKSLMVNAMALEGSSGDSGAEDGSEEPSIDYFLVYDGDVPIMVPTSYLDNGYVVVEMSGSYYVLPKLNRNYYLCLVDGKFYLRYSVQTSMYIYKGQNLDQSIQVVFHTKYNCDHGHCGSNVLRNSVRPVAGDFLYCVEPPEPDPEDPEPDPEEPEPDPTDPIEYGDLEEFLEQPVTVNRYEYEILKKLEFLQYAFVIELALIFLLIFRKK